MDKEKLQTIYDSLGVAIRRAEYSKAFSEILKLFIAMKTANEKERADIMALVRNKMSEMDAMMVGHSKEMSAEMKQMQKDLMSYCMSEMKRMEDEQANVMNFMRDKARSLQSGKDGKNGSDGKNGVDGKDGSPDTADQILTKVQDKPEGERWDIEDVNGLRKELDELRKLKSSGTFMGGGGLAVKNAVLVYDLSSQLNGSTKTFSLPAFWRVLTVDLSSFPNTLRPTTDFTTDAATMQITFTSQIEAATSLASGQTCIITYVSA